MSGGHNHQVDPDQPLDGPIERLAPEAKVVGLVAFVLAVVATPVAAVAAIAFDLVVALTFVVVALVPIRVLARRLLIEIPFLALAAALVVLGTGPTVEVGPVGLSVSGLWSAWAVLSRATIGVLAASVLAATTTPADLLVALERLRLPRLLRTIAAVMIRYLTVLRLELDRLRLAHELRSPDRRRPRAAEVAGIGAALFVRTYERGERVHLAMGARGHGTGPAPAAASPTAARRATARDWALSLVPAGLAIVAAVTVIVTTGGTTGGTGG